MNLRLFTSAFLGFETLYAHSHHAHRLKLKFSTIEIILEKNNTGITYIEINA
jgi:hypothetical protein